MFFINCKKGTSKKIKTITKVAITVLGEFKET